MTAGNPTSVTGSSNRDKYPRGEADMRQLVQTHPRAGSQAAAVVGAARRGSGLRPAARSHRHAAARQGRRGRRMSPGGTASISAPPTRRPSTTRWDWCASSSATGAIAGLKIDGQHLNGVRALLQSRAPACPAGGVGGEAAGLLPGGLPDGHADQPRGGRRAVPLRHVLFVLQFPLVQPGAGLRSGVVLAGTPQGQDTEGADGPERRLCR